MQDAVRWQPYCVFDPLGFEKLINFGIGEPRVGPEINARDFPLVAFDNRRQHTLPSVGAVDVAGTKRAPFEVAELVEQEQRIRREPTRLEAAHLARRCRCPQSRLAPNDPAHRGIMTQAFCVIHILVSGKSPEHRLSQHSDESMPAVLAGACVGEYIAGHRGKAERGVEFPVREQAGVGGDH